MKDISLPVTQQMSCSDVCEKFGIQILPPHQDSDSGFSGYDKNWQIRSFLTFTHCCGKNDLFGLLDNQPEFQTSIV